MAQMVSTDNLSELSDRHFLAVQTVASACHVAVNG